MNRLRMFLAAVALAGVAAWLGERTAIPTARAAEGSGAATAPAAEPQAAEPPAGMVQPRYDESGKLLAPENYRGWVFVGASIGLSYSEAANKAAEAPADVPPYNPGLFHHTYMQPEAYAHYRATGQFPEKTILVLELYESVQKVEPNKAGFSQGARIALEVSVKDRAHTPEGWAYYNFPLKENRPAPVARAMPKGMCFTCHEQHAAEDRVFTQFYPILQEARKLREAEQAASPAAP